MLWAMAAAGLTGILFGLCLRVSSVIVASSAVALGSFMAGPFVASSFSSTVLFCFAAICALQLGYIAGLFVSCAWSRVNFGVLKILPWKPDVPAPAHRTVLVDRAGLR